MISMLNDTHNCFLTDKNVKIYEGDIISYLNVEYEIGKITETEIWYKRNTESGFFLKGTKASFNRAIVKVR